jgi:hypothetical protein
MKVSKVLELLNDMPLDEELIIKWYRKQDVEEYKKREISREVWEFITQWTPDYISEEDFGISRLLDKAEED